MANINDVIFDDCRSWIRKKRNKKNYSWEKIDMLGQENDCEANKILAAKIEDDEFPEEITLDIWHEIVKQMKEKEELSKTLDEAGLASEVNGPGIDEPFYITDSNSTSWKLYKKHLAGSGFDDSSIESIEKSSLKILKRLKLDTRENGPIKGLVVGNIQSGKTANMAGLMAMAADWGWNMFIILSGTIENLRRQTQDRMVKDLIREGNLSWHCLDQLSGSSPSQAKTQSLLLNDGSRERYFTVCLKVKKRLTDLINWLQKDPNKQRQMKILVIDDEADQASINSASKKDIQAQTDARTQINSLIINLVHSKDSCGVAKGEYRAMNYVCYTATPYANVLNEYGTEVLYPKDFIHSLRISNLYFGPQQIFGDDSGIFPYTGLDIVHSVEREDYEIIKEIAKGEEVELPKTLIDAINWFFVASAILRHWKHRKPASMLVHTSVNQDAHRNIAIAIKQYIDNLSEIELVANCKEAYEIEKNRFNLEKFRAGYPDYNVEAIEINIYPSFEDIIKFIKELKSEVTHIPMNEQNELEYHCGIHLCIDNCSNEGIMEFGDVVRLIYPSSECCINAPAFIVVGGSTLSRGLTIEGLVSTYFVRSVKQADTLMQMARWFGYRRGYELLPRLWLETECIEKFNFLTALDSELRQELVNFMNLGISPLKVGPKIKNTPKVSWLRITSANKSKSAQGVDVDFSGHSCETVLFDNDKSLLLKNIELTNGFLKKLGPSKSYNSGKSLVWENIDFNLISQDFLSNFKFNSRSSVFNDIDAVIKWVNQVTKDGFLREWNVIVGGIKSPNQWCIDGKMVGKVQRSQKTNSTKGIINIGVLRAPSDFIADIDVNLLPIEIKEKLKAEKKIAKNFHFYREKAGLEKTPQLIIYLIDKNSSAQNAENRKNLNAEEDIVGLCVVIPGSKSGTSLNRNITITIPDDLEEDN